MPRYAVYPSVDPATLQTVNNIASAVFPDPSQQAQTQASLMSAYKSGEDIHTSRQKRQSFSDASAAMLQGDLAKAIALGAASGDANFMEGLPKANLGYYAAGGSVPALPAGDPNDPLHDPTLTRLGLGAMVPAGQTGLGFVFDKNLADAADRYKVDKTLEAEKYRADKSLAGERYKADKSAETEQWKVTHGGGSTKYVDPYVASVRLQKVGEEIDVEARLALGGSDKYPLDPTLLADVKGIAAQYAQEQIARGAPITGAAAVGYALAQVRAANGGKGPQESGGWFANGVDWPLVVPRQTSIPDYKSPAADVFTTPPPVAAPTSVTNPTSTVSGSRSASSATSSRTPKNAQQAEADFAAAREAIRVKGKDRAAVVQRLKSAGYTDGEISAAGI